MKIAKARDAAEHRAMLVKREAWMGVQMQDNIRLDARTVESMNLLVARTEARLRVWFSNGRRRRMCRGRRSRR